MNDGPPLNVQPHDWVGSGGAFLIVGLTCLGSAIAFGALALRIGKLTESEGEGCLLLFLNVLLAFAGGAIGFFSASYPIFLFTTLLGAVTLPSLATYAFMRRLDRKG